MIELSERKKIILRAEFPHLSFSDDLDIERYFELRKSGRLSESIALYNNKIRRKYPDEQMRINLLSAYRKRDPYFNELLTVCLNQLAEKTISEIKKIVSFITEHAGNINEKNVSAVINGCETVVSAISPDRFEVVSLTDKYLKYAFILNFKTRMMKKASELIRQYVTGTILSVRAYKEELEERRRTALQRKNAEATQSLDFSKIFFTKEQLNAIVIPESITKIEDKVLAYTLKYWNVFSDKAFENSVLLYSRKYGTNHFDIFQAVKIGRLGNKRDEEILHNVLLNVSSGYYYNISGDIYLQKEWSRLRRLSEDLKQSGQTEDERKSLKENNLQEKSASVTVETKKKKKPSLLKKRREHNSARTVAEKKDTGKSSVKETEKAGRTGSAETALSAKKTEQAEKPVSAKEKTLQKAEKKKEKINKTQKGKKETSISLHDAEKKSAAKIKKNAEENKDLPAENKTILKGAEHNKTQQRGGKKTGQEENAGVTETPHLGSENINNAISQIIKRMTGKNYSIYRKLFFKTVRRSIRKVLEKNAVQKIYIFNEEQKNAENIIYTYLEENYDNPYQNWETSSAKESITKCGFNITKIEIILEEWIKTKLKIIKLDENK